MNMKHPLILLTVVVLFVATACTQLTVFTLNQMALTELSIQGDKIYIMGEFNSKSYNIVKTAIDKNTNVKTIVLTANPGSLDDETTFKLARYIRSKNLKTHLINRSVITSGAVDLFLSGVERTIEKGAKVGVHSWSDGNKQAKDFPRDHIDHNLNATYIKDMIGSDEFYWFTIYSAPADDIYWMRDEEIEKYKLITRPFLSPSNDQTPFGEKFTSNRKDVLEE